MTKANEAVIDHATLVAAINLLDSTYRAILFAEDIRSSLKLPLCELHRDLIDTCRAASKSSSHCRIIQCYAIGNIEGVIRDADDAIDRAELGFMEHVEDSHLSDLADHLSVATSSAWRFHSLAWSRDMRAVVFDAHRIAEALTRMTYDVIDHLAEVREIDIEIAERRVREARESQHAVDAMIPACDGDHRIRAAMHGGIVNPFTSIAVCISDLHADEMHL